jgi:hypothetical protein
MISSIRKLINSNFSEKTYHDFLTALDNEFPGAIDFRIAETPVFIDKEMGAKMIETCEYIIDNILDPEFLIKTERAIPKNERLSNEGKHTHFIAFDFVLIICESVI